jgi:hypothetical protein
MKQFSMLLYNKFEFFENKNRKQKNYVNYLI